MSKTTLSTVHMVWVMGSVNIIPLTPAPHRTHCENSGTGESGATPTRDWLEMHDMYVRFKWGLA